MTKAEIVRHLVEKSGLPRRDAVEAVEVFLATVKEGLQSGEKVSLVGFGTFIVSSRNPRNGHNPRTREKIQIDRKHVAKFKPGKAFREAVNDLPSESEA
jgi:DNA-binding protein HU-beta